MNTATFRRTAPPRAISDEIAQIERRQGKQTLADLRRWGHLQGIILELIETDRPGFLTQASVPEVWAEVGIYSRMMPPRANRGEVRPC